MVNEVRRQFEDIMRDVGGDRLRLIERIEDLAMNGEGGGIGFTAEEAMLIGNLLLNLRPADDEKVRIKDLSLLPTGLCAATIKRMSVVEGEDDGLRRLFQPTFTSLLAALASISRRRALGILNDEELGLLDDLVMVRGDVNQISGLISDVPRLMALVDVALGSYEMGCEVFSRLAAIVSEAVCKRIEADVQNPVLSELERVFRVVDGLMVFARHMGDEEEDRIEAGLLTPIGIGLLEMGEEVDVDGCSEAIVTVHPITHEPCLMVRFPCDERGCERVSEWAFLGYSESDGWTQVRDQDDNFLFDRRARGFSCDHHRDPDDDVLATFTEDAAESTIEDSLEDALGEAPSSTMREIRFIPHRPLDYNEVCRMLDIPNGTLYSAIHYHKTLPATNDKALNPVAVACWYSGVYSPRNGKKYEVRIED